MANPHISGAVKKKKVFKMKEEKIKSFNVAREQSEQSSRFKAYDLTSIMNQNICMFWKNPVARDKIFCML